MAPQRLAIVSFAALVAAGGCARSRMQTAGDPFLNQSPLAARVVELGAFRADVTGAGPAVYGLFDDADHAERAARALAPLGSTVVVAPAW